MYVWFNNCLLIKIFRQPDEINGMNARELEIVLNQARASNTLGKLALRLNTSRVSNDLPHWFSKHLNSARLAAEAVKRSVRWEVFKIGKALRDVDTPIIFLKGAAYVITGNSASQGRLFSDIDFLVPKHRIDEVEKALLHHGWVSGHLSKYDNRYYRQWMHEIPPLKHLQRRSVLDVHHAILPETARLKPETSQLIKASMIVDDFFKEEELLVLEPMDMLLHSATHLFHDGELEHGFRDMLDLDSLIKEYCQEPGIAEQLIARAKELDLEIPLLYAIRYCYKILATPLPSALKAFAGCESENDQVGRGLRFMDSLFLRALVPDHATCNTRLTALARWMLYVRSHYLRMPLHLLLPHLLRKAFFKGDK